MWQFLWGIFTILVGMLIVLKPGNQPLADWPKLPTLTPTPGGEMISFSRTLPTLTPTPGDGLAERPRRLPAPTPEALRVEQGPNLLPALTLTPHPVKIVDQGGTEWPLEISSVPIQPIIPPAQFPADLPIPLPEQASNPVVPPSAPLAAPAGYTAPVPTPTLEPNLEPVLVGPLTGLPVKGRISQDFGCSLYYTGIAGPGCPGDKPWFHDALDIAVVADTPVAAMMTGRVIFAGEDTTGPKCQDNEGKEERGYGLAVVVDNGAGWRALYAHLSKVDVKPGQSVTPETVLGAVGASGCVTGPHLHFGLQYNGTLVDPRLMILDQPVP
jgi:murein DD-endopeptidase MepM/ murein hydrolase activator NlpD